ncbi:phosphoribosylaminoimidazolesuccinocarboxamide synthase [Verrucomicrobia bacterium]|nr:phosphoribosylaminoimidazolesuccinocarboxamide synthase [Verrucomicrobiota bacterium]
MGKGDKPRNCFSTGFKNNYDDINWGVSENKPTLIKSGKVREIYQGRPYVLELISGVKYPIADLDQRFADLHPTESLEIVTTDRVSAFDHILNQTIPDKGKILNEMSYKWFDMMEDIVDNHIIKKGRDFTIVKKADPLPVECIVRGYLSGSGWLEYKEKQTVCGISLPSGLKESSKLPEPIFTPSTKSDEHDENISFEESVQILGSETANKVKKYSLEIYNKAYKYAYDKGIIIADTKFEFGFFDDEIILIDELLTPDSSRFWDKELYNEGQSQPSYDKQIIRDYLLQIGWDKNPPIPDLPQEIIEKTSKKYQEVYNKLFG